MSNDLQIYHVYFDGKAFIADVMSIIDTLFDTLFDCMYDKICNAIAYNSEASGVMKDTTIAQVKEISRVITPQSAEIEVGIDEGDIGGGLQTIIRVLVTLHGNGEIWTNPGGLTWKKDVTGPSISTALSVYNIPQFDQDDHSAEMMEDFEKNIKTDIDDFNRALKAAIDAIDYEKYLRIG